MDIEQLPGNARNPIDRIGQLADQLENPSAQDAANAEGPEVEVDKKKKKVARKPVPKITGHNLLDKERGQPKLYLDSLRKSEKLCKIAELKPIKGLNELMAVTREWAFTMNPRFEFDFFLEKCQRVGKTKEFTPHLDNLRRVHKGDLNLYDMMKEYDDRHVNLATDGRIENYMEPNNADKDPTQKSTDLVNQAENELYKEKQDEKLKKIDAEIQKRRDARLKRDRNLAQNKHQLDDIAQINESYRKNNPKDKGAVGSPAKDADCDQIEAEVKANRAEAKKAKTKFGNLPKFEQESGLANDLQVLDVKIDQGDLDCKIKKKVKLNPDAEAKKIDRPSAEDFDEDDAEYYEELARIEAEFAAMDEIEKMEGNFDNMDL